MALLEDLSQAVIDADRDRAVSLTRQALDEGIQPLTIIDEALTPPLRLVGSLFEAGELFLPEMLVAAQAMQGGMEVLQPLLTAGEYQPVGTVVIASAQGDIHDIGKTLVGMLLEGRGFKVIDLGVDVAPEAIVAAVEEHGAQLVGISALLTTTMLAMKKTVELLQRIDPDKRPRVMVGGAPVKPEFADEIGADGTASDAGGAVELALSLIGAE